MTRTPTTGALAPTGYREHTALGHRPISTCRPSASRSARGARFPTNVGIQTLHRGSGQRGHYTSPVRGRGRGAERVTRGGRGRRTASGGSQATCSAAGQPAKYIHTTCPANICYRYGQPVIYNGFCPNYKGDDVRYTTDFATDAFIII